MERPVPNTPEAELAKKQELLKKLTSLSNELLMDAEVYTPIWKEYGVSIPKENTQEVFQGIVDSPIGDLFKGLNGFRQKEGSDKPYDWEAFELDYKNPSDISLKITKIGPSKEKYSSISFDIGFTYENNGEEYLINSKLINQIQESFSLVKQGLVARPYNVWGLSSEVYQNSLLETGYDGTDGKEIEDLSAEHLEVFLSLFTHNLQEFKVKEQILQDQQEK